MSTRTKRSIDANAADPWWGDPEPATPPVQAVPQPATRRRRTRRGIGWTLLGLAVAPLQGLARVVSRSPRLRRVAIRLLVVALVLTFLAGSVGVILINNVVIGRTAELGELDSERRELRRENAILGAEAARLEQPGAVTSRAAKDLGMVQAPELPQFIYLDAASHQLTPLQLRRRSQAQARAKLARTARSAPTSNATVAATTPAPDAKEQR